MAFFVVDKVAWLRPGATPWLSDELSYDLVRRRIIMFDSGSLIGKQIHQFRIEEYIAQGAMGMVFKAFDSILSRTVALKIIPKTEEEGANEDAFLCREEARKRLVQEAKTAGRLAHPNIVTIHSYGDTAELQYICMEYVGGKTLGQVMREKKVFSEDEVLSIFEQVLLALEAANKEGIIHRDIKPSNIMITEDQRVKVMDFGIAKLPSLSMTVPGIILGTPFYMSPEQISGKNLDIRSDLFSTGAVLYEVLTGKKPFEGDNTATLTYKIIQSDPIPPDELNDRVSPRMVSVVLKALAKDPRERYSSPTEMLKDLRRLQGKRRTSEEEAEETVIGPPAQRFAKTELAPRAESKSATPPPAPATEPGSLEGGEHPYAAQRGRAASETPQAGPAVPSEARLPLEGDFEDQPDIDTTGPTPPDVTKAPKQAAGRKVSKETLAGEEKTRPWSAGPGAKMAAALILVVLIAAGGFLLLRQAKTPPSGTAPPPAVQPFSSAVPGDTGVKPPVTQPSPVKDQNRAMVDSLLLEAGRQFVSNPPEAQKLLGQVLSIEPNNFDARVTLARLLAFRKDYSGAIREYQQALRLNSQALELYYEVGNIYLSQGQYDAAIQNLEYCLALRPSNRDEVLTSLAFCYSQKNNSSKALDLYRQALQFNPNNQAARAFLASIPTNNAPSPKVETDGARIAGSYTVEGSNPNGSQYSGTAVIKQSGSSYAMTWNIANQKFSGSGTLSGKTLTINWKGSGSNAGQGGTVVYTLVSNGVLKGVWANGSGAETLSPIK
jgi:eukaryotic-like serine/threonine-protein kinase